MRSASLGVRPVVGSVVMSLTEKMPNCILEVPRCGVVVSLIPASPIRPVVPAGVLVVSRIYMRVNIPGPT
ncbi:hypothetical protein GCM10009746_22200 [Microbacterium paludicola]